MKDIKTYLLLLLAVLFIGCNRNVYSEALKAEEKLIESFIQRQGIIVVDEEPTEWEENVYWRVPDYDNFYFHLVERGDTSIAEIEAQDKVLLRFIRYTLDEYADTLRIWNTDDSKDPVEFQYLVSSDLSCTGWQVALKYMKYHEAQCKIICPSKLGFSEDNSTVTPYGYDIKFQIKPF